MGEIFNSKSLTAAPAVVVAGKVNPVSESVPSLTNCTITSKFFNNGEYPKYFGSPPVSLFHNV